MSRKLRITGMLLNCGSQSERKTGGLDMTSSKLRHTCKFLEVQSNGKHESCGKKAKYVASKEFDGHIIGVSICSRHMEKSNSLIVERCRELGLRIGNCLKACLLFYPVKSSNFSFS